MLFLKKLEGHRSISTSHSMAPPTISSNASICYNIEVEFWDNWGSRRTKRLTRLFLGLQPPGSPSKLQGAHTCLEYSIGGQACHLNRGLPIISIYRKLFFMFMGIFFRDLNARQRNCFLKISILCQITIKEIFLLWL